MSFNPKKKLAFRDPSYGSDIVYLFTDEEGGHYFKAFLSGPQRTEAIRRSPQGFFSWSGQKESANDVINPLVVTRKYQNTYLVFSRGLAEMSFKGYDSLDEAKANRYGKAGNIVYKGVICVTYHDGVLNDMEMIYD